MSFKSHVQLTLKAHTSISGYFTAMFSRFCSAAGISPKSIWDPDLVVIFLQGLITHFTFNRHRGSGRSPDLLFPHEMRADQSSCAFTQQANKDCASSSFDNSSEDFSFWSLKLQTWHKGQDTSCFEENTDPNTSVKEHDMCERSSFALKWKEPPVHGFWMMDYVASSRRVGGLQGFQFWEDRRTPHHHVLSEEPNKTKELVLSAGSGILKIRQVFCCLNFHEKSWDPQVTLVQN